jgi:transcriptional antiterminator RfaH
MTMQFWSDTNWFAIQARPHREQLAAAGVAKLDAPAFLPMIRQPQLVCGVERLVTKPLFTGYFFAKFAPALLLDTIRYTPGVLRVLGTAARPVPVDETIIAAIQGRLQADGFIHLESNPLKPGDRVIIGQGPLTGWIGQVEREWDDGKRVFILLEAIQQARVLVERRCLTLATDAD